MFGSVLASLGSVALSLFLVLPAPAASEFKDVSVRVAASARDPRLSGFASTFVMDDAAATLGIRIDKPQRRTLTVPYAEIVKVVAEVETAAKIAPGAIAPQKRFWFYFERKPGSYPERFSLEMGEAGGELLVKAHSVFGDRMQELAFPLADEFTNMASLSDLSINYSVHVVRPGPALPPIIKDHVLVVVICPAVEGAKRETINLDADGRVIAANEPGTWSFENLDPGEYAIVAQAANARWIRVKLEANHAYYFFQEVLDGGERTGLSMHSKEMAQFELSGAAYSDWRRGKY